MASDTTTPERMSAERLVQIERINARHVELCDATTLREYVVAVRDLLTDRDALTAELEAARATAQRLELNFAARAETQRQWLNDNAPYVSHDQKHLDADTEARAYCTTATRLPSMTFSAP